MIVEAVVLPDFFLLDSFIIRIMLYPDQPLASLARR
jgi:hypothetical protein